MKDGRLDPDELRDLGTQLLSALSTIHPDEARITELEGRSEEGQLDQATFDLLRELKADALVHRDINPKNVMIRSDGTVVLVDFGISSRAGTQAKTSSGTYDYWPPDLSVVALDRWDPDVDRYAAGATLFEAACGVLPYHGVDRQEDVAELQAFRSDLPAEVAEFFLDACWPDRDGRFRSTAEMAKAWQDAWTEWEPASVAVKPFTPWTFDRHWELIELDDEDLRGLVVEIVETEGPILCRRLYDLVAAAVGERPTAQLNRLVYRMVSQWDGPLSQVEPLGNGQQDKTVYMAGVEPHVVRTLGERELWDLPGVERRAHIAQVRRSLGLANEADGNPAAIADLVAMSLAPDRTPEERADLAERVHHWIAPHGR
jgi:serine/threonine protein kinase